MGIAVLRTRLRLAAGADDEEACQTGGAGELLVPGHEHVAVAERLEGGGQMVSVVSAQRVPLREPAGVPNDLVCDVESLELVVDLLELADGA